MAIISIYFTGRPGDDNDTLAHKIVERFGGTVVAGGTFIPQMERDLEASLPDGKLDDCLKEFAAYPAFRVPAKRS